VREVGSDNDKKLLTEMDRVWVGTQWSMRIPLSATSTQRLGRVHNITVVLNTTTSLAYIGLVASITVLFR